jgi:hypothetical protein
MNDAAEVFALPEKLRVLVTAGASGIGRAAADLLIVRGAQVHICDVSDEFLTDYRAAHPKAGVSRADVASEAESLACSTMSKPPLADSTRSSTTPGSPGQPAASRKSNPKTGGAPSTSV